MSHDGDLWRTVHQAPVMQTTGERESSLCCVLDTWCMADLGERAYEVSATRAGWLVRLRSDRNGLLTEQTEKPTKADALASAAWIVTANPYLE